MNRKILNYGLSFIIGLLIGIAVVLGYADYKRQIGDSLLYLYMTTLNTIIMSLLTFFIYKVNERAADTNEKIANITALQVYSVESRLYSKVISKTKKHIESANILKFMTYPYLPLADKRRMIIEALSEDKTFNKHSLTFLGEPDLKEIPEIDPLINLKAKLNTLDDEEKSNADYINGLFNNAMPNSIHALWTLEDANKAFNSLRQFLDDEDFYEFAHTTKEIGYWIRHFEQVFNREIQEIQGNSPFKNLNFEENYARIMYLSMHSVLENLAQIEEYAIEKYKESKI